MRPCLVLTRPQASCDAFAAMARAAGWRGDIMISPLLDIAFSPPSADALQQARVLIFTSQHAVAALAQASTARHWPVWAVGPRTAQAARDHGFKQVHQAGGDAKALLSELAAAQVAGPFLHLRGEHVVADITASLQALGQVAEECVVYSQNARSLSPQVCVRIAQGGDLVLPVFSPRSAALLVAELGALEPDDTRRIHLVAISRAAAKAATALPAFRTEIAPTPDAQGMLAALSATQAKLEPWEKPS